MNLLKDLDWHDVYKLLSQGNRQYFFDDAGALTWEQLLKVYIDKKVGTPERIIRLVPEMVM